MIRTATTARAASVRESPELRSWVALCEEVRRALDEPPWGSVIRGTVPLGDAAPLLADAVFSIDLARATAWLRHLFTRAAAAGGPAATLRPERLSEEHVRALLRAAIAEEEFEQLAQDVDAEPGALGPVASLGAMPLLHAARRTLDDAVPRSWAHGYCPVCGAWATLAEARGVERNRQYRCARCGSGWFAGWLRCPYCGNADHHRAAALVGDDQALDTERRRARCAAATSRCSRCCCRSSPATSRWPTSTQWRWTWPQSHTATTGHRARGGSPPSAWWLIHRGHERVRCRRPVVRAPG